MDLFDLLEPLITPRFRPWRGSASPPEGTSLRSRKKTFEQTRPLILQPDYEPLQARFRRLTAPCRVPPEELSDLLVNSEPLKNIRLARFRLVHGGDGR